MGANTIGGEEVARITKEEYRKYLEDFFLAPYDKDIDRKKYTDVYSDDFLQNVIDNTYSFILQALDNLNPYEDGFYYKHEIFDLNYIFTNLVGGHHPDCLIKVERNDTWISKYVLDSVLERHSYTAEEIKDYYNEDEQMGHMECVDSLEIDIYNWEVDAIRKEISTQENKQEM